MTENYNGVIQARITYELEMAMPEGTARNLPVAEPHDLITEIHISILGAIANVR
jgi:hypothetical protein